MAKAKEPRNENLVQRAENAALEPWEERAQAQARDERAKEVLGVPRITHRGGVFKIDGQAIKGPLKLAIVDWRFEKDYFGGKFDPNNTTPPDCYAFGTEEKTMKAHVMSPDPQNKQPDGTSPCAGCQHNRFNTAEVGRGKRCKDYRRLLVISPIMGQDGKPKLDPEAVQKAEHRQLQIPPASLKNWGNYLTSLKPVSEGGMGLTRTGNAREMMVEVETYALDNGGHGLSFKPAGIVPREAHKALIERSAGAEEVLTQAYPVLDAPEQPKTPPRGQKANRKLD